MARMSLSLGKYWEEFIEQEIESGRYTTASEVVRDALRELENRRARFELLRAHLAEGEGQSAQNEFMKDFSIEAAIERARARARQ